ncbi:uncharacterized protein [Chiloscyllium punctatum]|uniref:uncharacterized protein n=1 Tax=Chiloscyllium punctatum TaxID=137246 RepID=UPI003B639C73
MVCKVFLAWILFCSQVISRPLSSELEKEDEKVTRCIVEVISDTLSKPNPLPVSSECNKILKEDERILAMVRHQNLLKELEELTHHEATREGATKKSDKKWNYPEEDSIEWREEKRMNRPQILDKKGLSAERRDDVSHREWTDAKKDVPLKREEDLGEYEESEEDLKEQHGYKIGKDDTKVVLHESEEELSEDEKQSPEKRHRESSEEEDRSSREDKQEDRDILQIDKLIEKIAREELEEEDGKRADEKKHHVQEYSSEEEEEDYRKRSEEAPGHVTKRVEENASDEETDQFETEEKGVKVFDSKSQLHETDDKRSLEKKAQDEKRHHFLEEGMGLKRHDDELDYLEKRHHGIAESEEVEEEEREEERKLNYEERRLKSLVAIEKELKSVAEKLREIRKG